MIVSTEAENGSYMLLQWNKTIQNGLFPYLAWHMLTFYKLFSLIIWYKSICCDGFGFLVSWFTVLCWKHILHFLSLSLFPPFFLLPCVPSVPVFPASPLFLYFMFHLYAACVLKLFWFAPSYVLLVGYSYPFCFGLLDYQLTTIQHF